MLLMTIGYTILEQAQIRRKNRRHIVVKNLMIILLSLLSFFILGYAISFGNSSAGIIGGQTNYMGVFSANGLYHERQFPFYFATCLLVSIISSGSMSERTRLEPILFFTIILNTIVYPPIMSWTWNQQGGFLSNLGFIDRGGCTVIFHTAGIVGIIGAIVVGPRYGRFMAKTDEKRIFSAQATKANDMMMMYQYKSEKDSSSVTA
jgi:Amt family ammonium transporter